MFLNIRRVNSGERLVDLDTGNGTQAVENIRHIRHIDKSAGPGTALAVFRLSAAENGYGVARRERERPAAVLQQHHAVRRRFTRDFGKTCDRPFREVFQAITGNFFFAIHHTVLLCREMTHSNRKQYSMGVSAFQGKKHRFTVLFHVIRHSVQSPGFRFVGVVGFARLRHRQRVHGGDVREVRGEVRLTLDADGNRLFVLTEEEQI